MFYKKPSNYLNKLNLTDRFIHKKIKVYRFDQKLANFFTNIELCNGVSSTVYPAHANTHIKALILYICMKTFFQN